VVVEVPEADRRVLGRRQDDVPARDHPVEHLQHKHKVYKKI
jgi:hypothetical protein